jgi:O-antigen/teichoic acid export membrane protein
MTTAPLTERAMTALAWRFSAKVFTFGLRLVILVVLARLVSVEAFGLINQAVIVINLAAMVSEIGMGPALVQRQQLTDAHIRVAFTVSILCGLVLMVAAWSGAPLAAAAFRTPELVPVLRLLSVSCIFSALGTTASSLLQRRLAFRRLFGVEFTSYLIGYGVVGVSLAACGYGVWALAWGPVTEALLRAVLLYSVCPHALRPSLARPETRQLFHFGAGMTLSRFANYAALTGDNFIVGRQLGTVALGLYGRAYQLMTLPVSEISDVVGAVLFPAYAEIQNEPERLRRAALASMFVSALVAFPLLATLAVAAPELVVGLLGAEWKGAVLPLQILCAGGVFRMIYSLGDSVARARGAVYAQFWRKAVYALCVFAAALVGSRWGITAVAVGVVGALGITYLLMAQLQVRLIGTSWRAFIWAQVPGLILAMTVAMLALPVAALLRAATLPPLVVLALTLLSCLIAAVTAGFLLPRRWHDQRVLGALRRAQTDCVATLKRRWLEFRRGRPTEPAKVVGVNGALRGIHKFEIGCNTSD